MIHIPVIILLIYESIKDMQNKEISIWPVPLVAITGAAINYIVYGRSVFWILSGAGVGLIVILCAFLSRQKIGYGDGILFTALGACLGAVQSLWLIWLSMILAGIIGLVRVLRKKSDFRAAMPYVPFVTVCYVIWIPLSMI